MTDETGDTTAAAAATTAAPTNTQARAHHLQLKEEIGLDGLVALVLRKLHRHDGTACATGVVSSRRAALPSRKTHIITSTNGTRKATVKR